MAIKTRIEKAEKAAKPKREAIFIIMNGRADGHAFWRDDLKWQNLSRPAHEQLAADLEGKGIKVSNLNIGIARPNGGSVDGWGVVVDIKK